MVNITIVLSIEGTNLTKYLCYTTTNIELNDLCGKDPLTRELSLYDETNTKS